MSDHAPGADRPTADLWAEQRHEVADDLHQLHALGYAQELARRLGGFSSFALSLSIICILAGGVTSFHLGLSSVGGAAIGLGWPLIALFALGVAATMGHLASACPTAGGLYHWASLLGGRGWGWATAWFNLAGLVTVLAAINVGAYRFALDGLAPRLGIAPGAWSPGRDLLYQTIALVLITGSQAAVNHVGVGLTARLTDFSGWWILGVSAVLVVALLAGASSFDPGRLVTFSNLGGPAGGDVWPASSSLAYLFALGLLLPAYTITGFDASAHVAEETVHAAHHAPRGIVRSVLVSGLAGWILLAAAVLAAPGVTEAAVQGSRAFAWILEQALPPGLVTTLLAAIVLAQYLCGLATVTSASRMAFAFARDGGLPGSSRLRWVSHRTRTPPYAIWAVAVASVLFTVHTPLYSTITAVCTILLYVSYVLPTALAALGPGGRELAPGPWSLGGAFRPLALASVLGCAGLIAIGIQPPNERAGYVVLSLAAFLFLLWFGWERRRFAGPPREALRRGQRLATPPANEPPHAPDAEETAGGTARPTA